MEREMTRGEGGRRQKRLEGDLLLFTGPAPGPQSLRYRRGVQDGTQDSNFNQLWVLLLMVLGSQTLRNEFREWKVNKQK